MYAVLCCFKVELVLCALKFLWSLALVYGIQLTFDSHNMGHFESYHVDKRGIRNLLVLVAWKSVENEQVILSSTMDRSICK